MFEDMRAASEYEQDEWADDGEFEISNLELISLYPGFWSIQIASR